MGAQPSGLCTAPAGFTRGSEVQTMQVTTMGMVEGDKIDPWTVDMGQAADVPPNLLGLMTCGGSTAPPGGYLADSVNGAIVFSGIEDGPIFREKFGSSEDNRVLPLDPTFDRGGGPPQMHEGCHERPDCLHDDLAEHFQRLLRHAQGDGRASHREGPWSVWSL
mmetsp:Transcript_8148/g.22120  ORF Transcript_8148/g.22120 Transcript_8148/m.22120 type:complete len:163 (-) Transcript_8148:27-515(-)